MKKQLIFATLLLFLGACSQQEDMTPDSPQIAVSDPFTGTAHDIYVNILTNRFDGYHKNKPDTRAESAFSITPYTEDGDTLMYVVQYEKGWELYSASPATNMLIFSSDKGVFDMDDQKMPKAMRTLLEAELENVRISKSMDISDLDASWGPTAVSESELANGNVSLNKNGVQTTMAYSDTPPGTWVLINTEKVSETTYSSPKLIQTSWDEDYPWNTCAPFYYINNQFLYTKAGCSPVAIAQYQYYTNSKDGVPSTVKVPSTLVALNSSQANLGVMWGWEYANPTATLWKQMALDSSQDETKIKNAAILIGFVGAELNSEYGLNETATTVENEIRYLYKVYNKQFTTADFDLNYIMRSIDSKYPVFARASYTSSDKLGHRFLIDQYATTTTTYRFTYGLVIDPWTGEGDNPWEDNDRDAEGNIIGYTYTNEVERTSTSDRISMNWGDDLSNNSTMYYPTGSWNSNNRDYKYNRTILKRSDIK